MRRPSVLVVGAVLLAAVGMSLVAAVAVGTGFGGAGQSGPMEFDELLASDSVVGVTRHDAFAAPPGLKIWAPGSVAKATTVWGMDGDRNGLMASGGRFNVISEGEDRGATQDVGSSRYEIVYRTGDGPHVFAAVHGSDDEAMLTQRFGPPVEDPVGVADRVVAYVALWAGPVATIAAFLVIGSVGGVVVSKRRSSGERE